MITIRSFKLVTSFTSVTTYTTTLHIHCKEETFIYIYVAIKLNFD